MKERRSREDYDLEPQAEQEEGMKKYSGSKKMSARARWRTKRGKSSRGKIIPWTLEIIMTRDDSVNLSVRRVIFVPVGKNNYIAAENKNIRIQFSCLRDVVEDKLKSNRNG